MEDYIMKMWEIRENAGHSKSEEYECGYEDGYAAAMEEIEGRSNKDYDRPSRRGAGRYASRW